MDEFDIIRTNMENDLKYEDDEIHSNYQISQKNKKQKGIK